MSTGVAKTGISLIRKHDILVSSFFYLGGDGGGRHDGVRVVGFRLDHNFQHGEQAREVGLILFGNAHRVHKHLLHVDAHGQHPADQRHGRVVAHLVQVRPVPSRRTKKKKEEEEEERRKKREEKKTKEEEKEEKEEKE